MVSPQLQGRQIGEDGFNGFIETAGQQNHAGGELDKRAVGHRPNAICDRLFQANGRGRLTLVIAMAAVRSGRRHWKPETFGNRLFRAVPPTKMLQ